MNKSLFGLLKRQRPNGIALLESYSFRGDASHAFVKGFSDDIDEYELVGNNLVASVSTSTSGIRTRLSVDRGATFDSNNVYGQAGFAWGYNFSFNFGSNTDNFFHFGISDNDPGYGTSANLNIFCNSRGKYTTCINSFLYRDTSKPTDDPGAIKEAIYYRNTKRVNGLLIYIPGGVIVSGDVHLYGYLKQ